MKTLIGKTISFYGADFSGRINEKGVIKSIVPTAYNEKCKSDITLDSGYVRSVGNKDIERLLESGSVGGSKMLIGNPMEIKILN